MKQTEKQVKELALLYGVCLPETSKKTSLQIRTLFTWYMVNNEWKICLTSEFEQSNVYETDSAPAITIQDICRYIGVNVFNLHSFVTSKVNACKKPFYFEFDANDYSIEPLINVLYELNLLNPKK